MHVIIETIIYLLKKVARPLHIILRGFPFSMEYMAPLLGYLPLLHFADSAPFILARSQHYEIFSVTEQKLKRVHHKPQSVADRARMIEKGLRAREEFLDFLSGGSVLGIESLYHMRAARSQ